MWKEREKIEEQYDEYKISQREAKELLCKNYEKWYYSYEKELNDKEFYIIFEFKKNEIDNHIKKLCKLLYSIKWSRK